MSDEENKLSPTPFTPEEVVSQTQALLQQKGGLENTANELQEQLTRIQTALQENDALKVKIAELMHESYAHFLEEWKRKTEYFPEIRLKILLKSVEFLGPNKKG